MPVPENQYTFTVHLRACHNINLSYCSCFVSEKKQAGTGNSGFSGSNGIPVVAVSKVQ